ncbi:MAG: hypothetical protein ACLUVY_05585 [Bacteroides uniformis]
MDARREKGCWIVRTEHAGKTETVEARALMMPPNRRRGSCNSVCPTTSDGESRGDRLKTLPRNGQRHCAGLDLWAILKGLRARCTIARPEDYDPALFACRCANPLCTNPRRTEPCMVERDDDELRTAARRENHDKLAHRGNDHYTNMIDPSREEREAESPRRGLHALLPLLPTERAGADYPK